MTLVDRITRTEWAVRFTAPAEVAGIVVGIRETRDAAEEHARLLAGRCHTLEVVRRTVTAWEVAAGGVHRQAAAALLDPYLDLVSPPDGWHLIDNADADDVRHALEVAILRMREVLSIVSGPRSASPCHIAWIEQATLGDERYRG